MKWFNNFFKVIDSDSEDGSEEDNLERQDDSPGDDEGDDGSSDFGSIAKNIGIALVITFVVKTIAVWVVPDSIGLVWELVASFFLALLILGVISQASKKKSPYISGPVAFLIIILFVVRMLNQIDKHREAQARLGEEKRKTEVVITPPLTVAPDTIDLHFGDNVFTLKAGEITPVLVLPSTSCCKYSIDSQKRTHGVMVAGHNKIYGYSDIIPRTTDGSFRITVPEDDKVTVTLSPL